MTDLVAFDIDGTLTRDEVLSVYRSLNKTDVTVGIITRRLPILADSFIEKMDIEADFVRSAVVKTIPMMQIQSDFNSEDPVYIGNRLQDREYARLAGWSFLNSSDIKTREDVLTLDS